MTETGTSTKYVLEFDEKVTPAMAYSNSSLAWGDLITKEIIRVSTWLRTPMAPQYICLHQAQMLLLGDTPTPLKFPELHIPVTNIVAFHMLPPARDPLDYDPSEPNRKMEQVTGIIGPYRFDGAIRVAGQTNLQRFLEVSKEEFIPLYEVEISQPQRPALRPMRVPYLLIRREASLFSPRSVASKAAAARQQVEGTANNADE